MSDEIPVYDPLEGGKHRMVRHRDGTVSYVLKKRPRARGTVAAASPELLAKLAQRCPIPSTFIHGEGRLARSEGRLYYWSEQGCKHHGKPMLRYAGEGNCVACDMERNEARRALTAMRKQQLRLPLDQLPRTQAQAILQGTKTYFTGLPCAHGHLAERRTRGKRCMQCADPSYVLPPDSVGPVPDTLPPLKLHLDYPVEPAPRLRNPPPQSVKPNTPPDSDFLADLDRLLKR